MSEVGRVRFTEVDCGMKLFVTVGQAVLSAPSIRRFKRISFFPLHDKSLP